MSLKINKNLKINFFYDKNKVKYDIFRNIKISTFKISMRKKGPKLTGK